MHNKYEIDTIADLIRCLNVFTSVRFNKMSKRDGIIVKKGYHNTNRDWLIKKEVVDLLIKHGLCRLYGKNTFEPHSRIAGYIAKKNLMNAERILKIDNLLS